MSLHFRVESLVLHTRDMKKGGTTFQSEKSKYSHSDFFLCLAESGAPAAPTVLLFQENAGSILFD